MESTDQADDRAKLIAILQLAYSGELAAGYAYRGHWHSVTDPEERVRIKTIEGEEWHHRQLVGEMLRSLGAGPNRKREVRATIIGRVLGVLCHLSGWLVPMYGEHYFRSRVLRHRWAPRLAIWTKPPPKENIRSSFGTLLI